MVSRMTRAPVALSHVFRARSGRRLRRFVAAILVGLAALSLGSSQAQEICADHLRAAFAEDAAPARVATALARAALTAIEPALPEDRRVSQEWDDPDAAWLQRRGFLPNGWNEEELDLALWASLLANLQVPYHVEPREVSGSADPSALFDDVARALTATAAALRPLALVATEPGDEQAVAFAGVIWNWTPYPRLLVFEPSELVFAADGSIDPVLASLGTCAWQPDAYLTTNADNAANYYLGNTEATMRLLATDQGHVGETIPEDQERDVLAFRHEALDGARIASVGFEGPGPSVGQVAGLISRVRTNLGVFDMGHFLAFP